jgi:hypothetical protein
MYHVQQPSALQKHLVFCLKVCKGKKKTLQLDLKNFPTKQNKTEYLCIMSNNHQRCKNTWFSAWKFVKEKKKHSN